MDDDHGTQRTWRLHWSAPSEEQAGLSADSEGVTTLWIGSDDPAAIKAFVAARDWPTDATVEVSVHSVSSEMPPPTSILCEPAHVVAWAPSRQLLPEVGRSVPRARSRTQGRLALLQAIRSGVDAAVAVGALDAEDGAGLMFLAQDALDRHERRRRSNP